MLIVEFQETELSSFGVVAKPLSAETGENEGLARHVGIPWVDAMSTLEMECAKIIQALQKKGLSCRKEGHHHCYIKGKVHGRLTNVLLSSWECYIHDHVATILKPPKAKAFDFTAHQKEIDT
ncbi:hypothetical protein FRC10_000743 [Ceratobasidium sp. 414]|nr:hypothetical protein FRC10_000743 [Ceratobasidium sp. 414]